MMGEILDKDEEENRSSDSDVIRNNNPSETSNGAPARGSGNKNSTVVTKKQHPRSLHK
jgi:hypothetical protein